MTFDENIARLKELLPGARASASKVGTMSALWDSIFDAEALIKGETTLLRGAPDEIAATLITHLNPDRALQHERK